MKSATDETNTAAAKSFFQSLALLLVAITAGGVILLTTRSRQLPEAESTNATLAPLHKALPKKNVVVPTSRSEAAAQRRTEGPSETNTSKQEPGAGARDNRDDVDTAIRDAFALIDQGSEEDGIAKLKELVEKNPSSDHAWGELGFALLKMNDPKQAAESLLKALTLNPRNDLVAEDLADALQHDTDGIPAGLAAMKELYAANPDAVPVASAIGRLMVSQGQPQEAIPYLQNAAEQGENKAFTYSALGDAYLKAGANDQAISTLRQALDYQTKEAENDLAQGRPPEHSNRHLVSGNVELARALIKSRRLDEAEKLLRKASELAPGDQEVTSLLDVLQLSHQG